MKHRWALGCLAAGITGIVGIAFSANSWREQKIGVVEVRRHGLTGIVQLKVSEKWQIPFENDPQAQSIAQIDLDTVKLTNIAWGDGGLLTGTITTAPSKPITGRLSFVVKLLEKSDGSIKRVRDRSLRQTVRWPAGTTQPFVLATGLEGPVRNQSTELTLENVR
jgi:hypothetical protein